HVDDYASCFQAARDKQGLHAFPTRRSSDLDESAPRALGVLTICPRPSTCRAKSAVPRRRCPERRRRPSLTGARSARRDAFRIRRSEEHTSELQSRENLVCRLLLEKTNVQYS